MSIWKECCRKLLKRFTPPWPSATPPHPRREDKEPRSLLEWCRTMADTSLRCPFNHAASGVVFLTIPIKMLLVQPLNEQFAKHAGVSRAVGGFHGLTDEKLERGGFAFFVVLRDFLVLGDNPVNDRSKLVNVALLE